MRYLFLTTLLFATFIINAQTASELYAKGAALKKEKKISEAITAFKEATSIDPKYKDALYELGWCYNDIKDYQAAIVVLRKARGLGMNTANMFFEFGYAFEKTDKLDSAFENYNRCIAINPNHSGAHKQLAFVTYTQEKYPQSMEFFKKAEELAKNPITDYLFWYRRGFVNNALKNYQDAKNSLYRSIASNKEYINSFLEMGFACSRLKQNDSAIYYYNKAMELDPKSHIPYNGIAEVYRDNYKNIPEAMNWYRKTLNLKSYERKANFGMGYCLNSEGKYNEASTYLKKAIEQESTYTAAYVELGYSYYMTGNNSLALENLNKALVLNPVNENARYYSGLIYIKQGNKTQAQKMVDELKSLNSKNTSSLQEKVSKM